jgi:hypothetical protein
MLLRGLVFAGGMVVSDGVAVGACVGDCGGDGTVTINELIIGVKIALGAETPSVCPAFQDAQGAVTIARLIQGVNNALNGCPSLDGGLAGEPGARALDAVAGVFSPDAFVAPTELSGSLVRTQVELAFRKDATVGQVNDLLRRIGGRIVSSRAGVLIFVVRIPDPGSVAALDQILDSLSRDVVLRAANPVIMSEPEILPGVIFPGTARVGFVRQQLAVRAHAAWNARAALGAASPPTLVLGDFFGDGPPDQNLFGVLAEPSDFGTDLPNHHGYLVLGIAAGSFDDTGGSVEAEAVTGMFPGPISLRVADIAGGVGATLLGGATLDDRLLALIETAPGTVVLNTSLGTSCETLEDAARFCTLESATSDALRWIERVRGTDWPGDLTHDLEEKFLHATAAGNVESIGRFGADMSSKWNAATLLSPLVDPVTLEVVPNLTNTLVVENFTSTSIEPFRPNCVAPSSEVGGTIAAIGSPVYSFAGPNMTQELPDGGTSSATPQVAGLAAYVWALRAGLAPAELVSLLQRTAEPANLGCGNGLVIDSYAAVLAADENNPVRPVRRALLDVADNAGNEGRNGTVDEHDIDLFVEKIEAPDAGQIDYGRYDLNGDGRTGIPAGGPGGSARVDLDLDGSYGLATLDVEGLPLRFDENAGTDLRILCHFAYSPSVYDGNEAARRERLGLQRCLDLSLETQFPDTVQPAVNNLLIIRAVDLELTDPTNPNEVLGQAGVRIELTVSGGAVDNFFGTTNVDGIFQTNARLFVDQPELTIEVIARAGENGLELARRTVRAAATVTNGGDIAAVNIYGGTTPGPFELDIQLTDGPGMQLQGSLDTILPALHAALAGVGHIGQFQIDTGVENGLPASFAVSLAALDVDQLFVTDQACGSTFNLTLGRVIRAVVRGCQSTITAQLADVVGDGQRLGLVEISGTDSAVEVSAGSIEAGVIVGSDFATSSALRVGIHAGNVGGASVVKCAGCTVSIDGTIAGSFIAGGNANLSLGPLTLGAEAFGLSLQDNSFTAFGGVTGGDIVGPGPSRGIVSIVGNSGLTLSAITIGNISTELVIKNNHGFTNDDALAFANARTVGGAVRIAENNGAP